ncbi:MAG: addiction module protein [Phycisphaerales bacterium]|nr:addiction module protein [Phycisphaerales bacterium]
MVNPDIDVKHLSAKDRLNLIEQIWDSLEAEDVPVTEAQKAELDRRIDEMDRDGERGIPWDDVLNRIRGRAR